MPFNISINSILIESPGPFRTVPSEETATMIYSSFLDAPCSIAPTTSSLISPDNHSSTVATLSLRPCILSIDIGITSIIELVKKFCIPFFVGVSFCRFALEPVVFCKEPSVKNWNNGPLALAIEVLIGFITSPA